LYNHNYGVIDLDNNMLLKLKLN